MTDEAVILAGGLGTRLKDVVSELPKPLAAVNGRPFLEYLLDYLYAWGIKHIVLSVSYKYELIISHFAKSYKGMDISYAIEDKALGTGGAISYALPFIEGDEAFIINGDSFFDAPLDKFYSFHNTNDAGASLCLCYKDNASRYGSVVIDASQRVLSFSEKRNDPAGGYINAGIYLFNKGVYQAYSPGENYSAEKHSFPSMARDNVLYGFAVDAYFIDIGIAEDYKKAQDEFKGFKY